MRATMSAKGRLTVPKAVRDALGWRQGDVVVFRVEEHRAVLASLPDFVDLAGSVTVPAARRGVSWDDIRRNVRQARAVAIHRVEPPGP